MNQCSHRDGGTLDLIFAQKETKYFVPLTESLFIYDLCHSLTSDHKFIEFCIPFHPKDTSTKIDLSYRDFKTVDPQAFSVDVINSINETSADFFLESVNSSTNLFNTGLANAIEKHAPLIEISVKPKKTAFTNSSIIALRRKRRKAERDYRKSRNENDKLRYKSLVKEVKKLVKDARNDYYRKELASCEGNKKKTFKVFNKLLGNNNEEQLPSHDDEIALCNEFEHFFANKIDTIRNDICSAPSTSANKSSFISSKQCQTSFS